MTAAHNVKDGWAVYVGIAGRWVKADVIAARHNDYADIAVLGVRYSGALACVPIGTVVREGDRISMKGFPKGGRLRVIEGSVIAFDSKKNLWTNIASIQGDSGGPIIHDEKLVGIVSGSGHGETWSTGSQEIRSFLTEHLNGIPRCGPVETKPVKPSPGTQALLDRIAALEAKVQSLESREPEKGDRGPEGVKGDPGPPGEPGTITVVLLDNKGNQIGKAERLNADDVVRLRIDRFLKEK